MDYSTLPKDIEYNILEYSGIVKNRNGCYMFQIPKDDPRYELLQKIPKIVPYYMMGEHGAHITFSPSRSHIALSQFAKRIYIHYDYRHPSQITSYSYLNLLCNEENKDINYYRKNI